MPPEQIGHAKLCYVVDGKEIEVGDFFCDLQMKSYIECSDADGNVPDPTKPVTISGTIRIKKTPAHKKFRISRYFQPLLQELHQQPKYIPFCPKPQGHMHRPALHTFCDDLEGVSHQAG